MTSATTMMSTNKAKAKSASAADGAHIQNGHTHTHTHAVENGAAKSSTGTATSSSTKTAVAIAAAATANGMSTTITVTGAESEAAKEPETEEDMLRAYSKELYVYTLDLLNAVRIDNAQKGAGGKAYLLKRTISDIGVPLKGQVQGAKGTSNAHTSNGKSNGKSSKEALATAGVDAPS